MNISQMTYNVRITAFARMGGVFAQFDINNIQIVPFSNGAG